MLTMDNLRKYGANVDEGVARCLDDEAFYLELVSSCIPDKRIEELEELINAGDLDKAFEVAHALKGMYGNIAITPLYEPISEITKKLRARSNEDYSALIAAAKEKKARLVEIYNARN